MMNRHPVSEMVTDRAKRVLIADDHPLYRDALRAVVPRACGAVDVVEAACQDDVTRRVSTDADFDLVILDLALPGASGLSCLSSIRRVAILTPIIVVSGNDDPDMMSEVILAGATGYVPKSAPTDVLMDAIRVVMAGGNYLPAAAVIALRRRKAARHAPPEVIPIQLTARQLQVLQCIAIGMSNKRIARELEISDITVKAHVSMVLRRLRVSNRTEAAIEARRFLDGDSRYFGKPGIGPLYRAR